jgi:hypothetical protein
LWQDFSCIFYLFLWVAGIYLGILGNIPDQGQYEQRRFPKEDRKISTEIRSVFPHSRRKVPGTE